MDSFEEWKAKEREALKDGVDAALSKARALLLATNDPEEARAQLNWYAHFANLRDDKSDNLSVVARFVAYAIDRDGWTLFLICVQLFNTGLLELCVKACEQFLSEYDHDQDGARLLCAIALLKLGHRQKALDLAGAIVDPDVSVWAGGQLLTLSHIGDQA